MHVKMHALVCDGCGRWSTTHGFATAALAWQRAERDGWTRAAAPGGSPGAHDHHCGKCTMRRRLAVSEAVVGARTP